MIRRLLLAGVAALAISPGGGFAQTLGKFGTDNRAMTIGDLSEDQALAMLKDQGRVSMSGTFFDTGSAALTSGAGEVLFKLAKVLEGLPGARLAVVGHTDNVGGLDTNLKLSQARAQAVVDALLAEPNNMAPDRLVAVGVGAIDPIASNLSEEGKALNRRVTFVLIDNEDAQAAPAAGSWLSDPVTGCAIWTAGDDAANEGALWTGACINGEANGRGTLVFWDEQGFEARYDGDVLNGRADGDGTVWIRNEDGTGMDVYEGSFRAGQPDGEITVSSSTGYVFEGVAGDAAGQAIGKLTTPEGWVVSGEIKDGKSVGSALVFYETEEGEMYFGDAENGQRDGYGTLISADDSTYFGEFKQGVASGSGVFEAPDGGQFVGRFEGGDPNGHGTAIGADGTSYQGLFIDGKAEGLILVTLADGTQSTETWKDGSKVK